MSIKIPAALAIAALLLTPSSFLFAQAAEASAGQNPATAEASQEAAKMVPAAVAFISTIDSQKATSGTQIKVKLEGKVRLENGPVLPSGTILVGQVVDDTTQSSHAKLALRFTEADLKNGQVVPIKATIFNVYKEATGFSAGQGDNVSFAWDKSTLGVNQADAMPGIDLHSQIASPDSGVFVSTKKSAIKFSPSVQLELAIAPRSGSAQQSANGY